MLYGRAGDSLAATVRRRLEMSTRILVAYATKHGSTREVAEAIAAELGAELAEAREVDDVDGYDAVVLGGALYTGHWHADAQRFLARHWDEFSTRRVAIFGMGPKTLEANDVASSRRQLDNALKKVPEVQPVSVAIFGGVIQPEKLHFPFNKIAASDARDWDAIRDWARALAPLLVEAAVPS
jgi:menaquinone-dependent protoporphyrinogen oxidase